MGESVTIDCRLNDPSARVKLKQRVSSGVLIERFTDRCRISREGQKFVIHAVNFNDVGIYFCEAPHVQIKRKQEAFLKIDPGKYGSCCVKAVLMYLSVGGVHLGI